MTNPTEKEASSRHEAENDAERQVNEQGNENDQVADEEEDDADLNVLNSLSKFTLFETKS